MLHCNDIDPFVTLMGNFNWGPISRNDIVSDCERTSSSNLHHFGPLQTAEYNKGQMIFFTTF